MHRSNAVYYYSVSPFCDMRQLRVNHKWLYGYFYRLKK